MEKTNAIKEAYKKAQNEVKNIVVNEIKELVSNSTGILLLGETEDEEFGISHNGDAYCNVAALVTCEDGDTRLVSENGIVDFGDISTDEAVELHDLIFDRLMPRITEEVIGFALEEMFCNCESCSLPEDYTAPDCGELS